ncbi:MAG: hypothetical protein RJA52_1048 [Bacteroidota bacterium]
MIQRIQTIYLLITVILGIFSIIYFQIPSPFFYYCILMAILIQFFGIFLFKKRKLQYGMILIALFFTSIPIIHSVNSANYFLLLIILLQVILIIAAMINIRKDINLLKNADRLR